MRLGRRQSAVRTRNAQRSVWRPYTPSNILESAGNVSPGRSRIRVTMERLAKFAVPSSWWNDDVIASGAPKMPARYG